MPDRETDLLFGLLALQLGFVRVEQLLECVAVWTGVGGGSLEEMLRAKAALREDQAKAVRGMVEARVARSGVERTRVAPARGGGAGEAAPAVRYRLMGELGRGGLGRVVEAHDALLDRSVALKLALDDLPADLRERFVREARLAARLEHPAIVPVYDFGEVAGEDGRVRAFLAMKKVKGRDLSQVLALLQAGVPEARREWTRARLLRVFQDVCLGVAFAHDRGVIHRDIKPANVMLGEYGETMVVDWGLAREAGAKGGGVERGREAGAYGGGLTLEGDVVGTPAYMSPEQAEGRGVDHRADVYSLGAVLYEILTGRTPVEGNSVEEMLSLVRSGRIVAPSERVRAALAARPAAASTMDASGRPVPPELEALCMKALALRPDDRYRSAREMADEVQLFLEGAKQRERDAALAAAEVARAGEAGERHRRLAREAEAARRRAQEIGKTVPAWADKAELWATEDRAARLEAEAVEAFAEADRALTLALGHVKDHAAARRLKAEMAWERFEAMDAAGNAAEAQLARRVAEQFNDGDLDARLKGDGTLSVRTEAYVCRCLVEGRMVLPEELAYRGYHPFSGRALDGHAGAEGIPEKEPKAPVRMRAHGAECRAAAVAGADVWIWRYEEEGRLMVPVTPTSGPAGPDGGAAAARAFEPGSPFRPRGPGMHLGKTPVERAPLPMGAYLAIVAKDGFEPARVPVLVGRCEDAVQRATLFRPEEIPQGFVVVGGGRFTYQGDRMLSFSPPAQLLETEDLFVARHPVTCGEYAAFLNAIPAEEAARRVPREQTAPYWPGPPYRVPAGGEGRRIAGVKMDWQEDWPVLGVSWEDSVAFAAWAGASIPHEVDWEHAARGRDGRPFPMGRHMDMRWANNSRSFPDGPRPAPVTDFPQDESPYGIRGCAGNANEHCLNDPGQEMSTWRLYRGGFWTHSGDNSRVTYRAGYPPKSVSSANGFRLVRFARLPANAAPARP
ncbi:MAG: SUMF1/EgtB/PvdO family nonheme iron enzyme [Planctomycetia bacterium]|nr:SUMF1/EgtB/PvdO family nonheme iron enzyme [Planctomycetia bacterium]